MIARPIWKVNNMTMHDIIWQSRGVCKFDVVGEGEPFHYVTAKPVVTTYWFGTTVGLLHRGHSNFAHWTSSNICSALTAWRVAQILPRLKRLSVGPNSYDTTLCGLVIALKGDDNEKRLRHRAEDFDMTVYELISELDALRDLWPSENEICSMWDKLPHKEQDKLVPSLREAFDEGVLMYANTLHRLETAEQRQRDATKQREHEDGLIEKGLTPERSLRQFLLDIGTINLVYTAGMGEMWDPSHFDFDDLDRQIMRELIGDVGFCRYIPLITTARQPDDESAHHSSGVPGMAMFWSDFGDSGRPRISLFGKTMELVRAEWDRVTERFLLTLRPHGLEDDDAGRDKRLPIEELRELIGGDMGLEGPLPPGQPASWCVVENGAKPSWLQRLLGDA